MNKKLYKVLVPYTYRVRDEEKQGWTDAGIGFSSKDGEGINVELRPGISVNGRLILRPIDPKSDDGKSAAEGLPRFVHRTDTPADELM